MPGNQEIRLLERAAAGDTEAFRVLFESHREPVYRLSYHLTGSVDAAEDVAQECFLRLVRQAARVDPERGTIRQYLYGMVRNLVRQRLQAGGREVPLDDDHKEDGPVSLPSGTERIAEAEVAQSVQSAIAGLPLLQREALVLFEFEEMSLEEVARVAGCDTGTVKSRLHRARARLRRALAPCWKRMRTGEGQQGSPQPVPKGVCHEPAE